MPFLILTRAGFDDLIARVDPAGAVFHLNPGLIPADEIARLRDAGADVNVLARAVDRAPRMLWSRRCVPKAQPSGSSAPPT